MNSTSLKLDKIAEDLQYELQEGVILNTHGIKSYFDHLKLIDKLPFSKVEIYYSSPIWDFSPLRKLNIGKDKMRLNFHRANPAFVDDIKKFILLQILDNKNKIQSIKHHCERIINFFNYVADEKKYYYFKLIPSKLVAEYLKAVETEANEEGFIVDDSLKNAKVTIEAFYTFYAANFEDLYTTELKKILNRKKHHKARKQIRENNKTPDIPEDYFNKFLSALIKVIDDEESPLEIRAIACLFLIMSQIGLRWGEMLGLEAGQLKTTKLSTGETAYYVEYKTWKREKGNNTYTIAKTYFNELAKKGYDTLVELHKEKRESIKTDFPYLYMGEIYEDTSAHFPLSPTSTYKVRHKFYVYLDKYITTIDLPVELRNEGFSHIDASLACYEHLQSFGIKTLTYPDPKQFRVHVCTELYEKQVPLRFIKKFMGHLAKEMEGYYVRTEKPSIQEDEVYAEKVFNNIVSGLKPIGRTNLQGQIFSFIEKGNFNINTDCAAIVAKLKAEMPVRVKTGGFCCKSMVGFPCMSNEDASNDFYCAYDVCPNIFSFFYNADVAYRQMKELEFAIEDNKKRGHKAQLEKHYINLWLIIHDKLLPELEDLEVQIAKHGAETIIEKYSEDCPDLKHIIENLETIYTEVEKWKVEIRASGVRIRENAS